MKVTFKVIIAIIYFMWYLEIYGFPIFFFLSHSIAEFFFDSLDAESQTAWSLA